MIADFKTVRFVKDSQTNYYAKQPDLVPFTKIPDELKVEETQDPGIRRNGAEQVIRGRIQNKKYLFFTGLIPSKVHGRWYMGNHCTFERGNKKLSLILFWFSPDFRELELYYFNGFNLYPSERERFLSEFIHHRHSGM